MAYELLIAERAEKDLDAILDYICNRLCNPVAAAEFVESVERSYVRLEQNSRLHSPCVQPILRAAGYRKVAIGRYILICRVDDDRGAVLIERFFSELEDYAGKL